MGPVVALNCKMWDEIDEQTMRFPSILTFGMSIQKARSVKG